MYVYSFDYPVPVHLEARCLPVPVELLELLWHLLPPHALALRAEALVLVPGRRAAAELVEAVAVGDLSHALRVQAGDADALPVVEEAGVASLEEGLVARSLVLHEAVALARLAVACQEMMA